MPGNRVIACGAHLLLGLGATVGVTGLLSGCEETRPELEAAPLDPRVEQLRRWVPHRSGSGMLFFLDRFEARVADYRAAFPERRPALRRVDPELPISRLHVIEAIELARWFWGRLPWAAEWRSSVSGRAGYRYPWGDRFGGALRANTAELGLWRPARVGSFESGRNPGRPGACYDLIGNVSEWTMTPAIAQGIGRPELHWLRGMQALLGLRPDFGALSPCLAGCPDALRLHAHEWVPLVVVGRSFAERPQVGPDGEPVFDQARAPLDWSSTIGVRIATDPFTLLARLDAMEGAPLPAEQAELAAFLREYRAEFRAALRSLDEPVLQLRLDAALPRDPGAWGLFARRVLGP